MSDIFHFDPDRPSFEDLGIPNGTQTWRSEDLREHLEYQTVGFDKALMRAQQACLSLGIKTDQHFIPSDGSYKLTRFACYLVTMNGDPKKPGVAAAQLYFAQLANTFQTQLEHVDGMERVLIREEVSAGSKSLASTASRHGATDFALFQNAGYLGMYNMNLRSLMNKKGVPKGRTLLDYMGRTELAANLFRITQTDEKIKSDNIRGQSGLERAAENVGRHVRRSMQEISGTTPERLPVSAPIQQVKSKIKSANASLKRLDKKKSKKR